MIYCKVLNTSRDETMFAEYSTQSAFTCSKLTTETLEQGEKYVPG